MNHRSNFATIAIVVVAATVLSANAVAQNRVSVVSNFAHEGAGLAPACQQEADLFMTLAAKFPAPNNWRFVIVCDEPSWDSWYKKQAQYSKKIELWSATFLESRMTFIRGWALTHYDATKGDPTPAGIIAHEIATIMLHSTDEAQINVQALALLRQAKMGGAGQPRNDIAVFPTPRMPVSTSAGTK